MYLQMMATSWYKPGTRQEVAVPDHDLCTLLAPAAHATAPQLDKFDRLFDATCHHTLLPINQLDMDPTRQKIDRGITEILHIHDIDVLYGQLVSEPQFGRKEISSHINGKYSQ